MNRKTVLITGASGGIGQALARTFAAAGYTLCLQYHRNPAAVALAAELRESGVDAEAFPADIADESSVEQLMIQVKRFAGAIDVLVNNAGISQQALLTETTAADWRQMMGVHVDGAFYCCRAVLPGMIDRKRGSILNISSMWGVTGGSCEVAYSTAKAGLIGLTKALAKEVGPSGIRVNCLAPGVIDTPMNAVHSERTLAELAEETPLGRIGTPEEVAQAAVFLADKQASFITGQVLGIDGGLAV